MARIDSKVLFLTTSPRTPEKMIPEIELLVEHFTGDSWNTATQQAFMDILREEQFFNGKGEKDPALSARDRINRAPKSLGFVSLSPSISLTPAGQALLSFKRKDEVFFASDVEVSSAVTLPQTNSESCLFSSKALFRATSIGAHNGDIKI